MEAISEARVMSCGGGGTSEKVQHFVSNASVTHSIIAHYRVAGRAPAARASAAAAGAAVHRLSTPECTPRAVTTYPCAPAAHLQMITA